MRLIRKLKRLVQLGDFFHSSQMLRFRGDDEYRTLTGGIISIGIIITIIIGFFQMIMNTLNLSTITYTQKVEKKDNPQLTTFTTSPNRDFMFGIEIWGLNLSSEIRYFDVYAQFHYYTGGVPVDINMPLVACTKQHWATIPQAIRNFDALQIGGWLCPPIDYSFELFGKYSSDIYQELGFIVEPCKNETDPLRPCATQQQIDQLFVDNGDWFYFTYYFINTVINPDQTNYKTYYLEDEEFVIFGKHLGVEAFLYFTDYQITTDYSIFPFGNIVVDSGFLAEETTRKNQYMATQNNAFVEFNIAKSSRSLLYQRQVQKISTVFSFIGGLIGAIMAVMFIINSYTSFSYEISVALDVFGSRNLKSGKPVNEVQINKNEPAKEEKKAVTFMDFVKYNIFSLGKSICKKPEWPQMEYIYACRQEILNQLDVKSIIKRLVFLEYSLTYLFEDYQLQGLQLKKPTTPLQIKRIRQKIEMVTHQEQDSDLSEQNQTNSHQTINQKHQEQFDPPSLCLNFPVTDNFPKSQFKSILVKKQSGLKRSNILDVQILNESEVISEMPQRIIRKKKKLVERRNSNLSELRDAAEKGDHVSRKIWEKISHCDDPTPASHFKESLYEIPVEWSHSLA